MTTANPIPPFQGFVCEVIGDAQGVALGYRMASFQAWGMRAAATLANGDASRLRATRRGGFPTA